VSDVELLSYVNNNYKNLKEQHRQNVKKHRKLSGKDLLASIDIFHDCVATCAGHIKAGTATNFETDESFKHYLLKFAEFEFKKYLKLKDDYFLKPYRKVKRTPQITLSFCDTSNYEDEVSDDAFESLFRVPEFTEADIDLLKSVPEHVNVIFQKLYYEGKTQAEAAAELNISRDRVKNIIQWQKTKLRAKRDKPTQGHS
jgi:RNA polymerase sigma factor (sigma-70 family)